MPKEIHVHVYRGKTKDASEDTNKAARVFLKIQRDLAAAEGELSGVLRSEASALYKTAAEKALKAIREAKAALS